MPGPEIENGGTQDPPPIQGANNGGAGGGGGGGGNNGGAGGGGNNGGGNGDGGGGRQQQPPRNVVMLPHDAFNKRLNAERVKGERKLRSELDARAKELGYADLDALLAAGQRPPAPQRGQRPRREAAGAGNGAGAQGGAGGGNGGGDGAPARNADDLDRGRPMPPRGSKAYSRIQRQLEEERRARIGASRRARELESQVQTERTRRHLEKTALLVGIRDVDFAIHLLEQHASGLTDEEAQTFDESAYFAGLRKDRPYLFQDQVVPANTGTAGEGAGGAGNGGHDVRPPPPNGGGAGGGSGAGNGAKVDARKMSSTEFQDYLSKKGLNMVGIPMG
jgi:hypothetical protein